MRRDARGRRSSATEAAIRERLAARTVHGAYSAEMRKLRGLVRQLRAGAKRLVELM